MRPLSPKTHEIVAGNTEEGRIHAMLRPSHFPPYTFETWPHANYDEHTEWLREWAADTDKPIIPGIILCGGVGVGKTGLMISALSVRAAMAEGDSVLWPIVTMPSLVKRVLERGTGSYFPPVAAIRWSDYIKRYRAAERDRETEDDVLTASQDVVTLGVDDIGVGEGRRMPEWREELLLDLVLRAERNQRTIFTTNVPMGQLGERFGQRITDRLLYRKHFAILNIEGGSLRRVR